MSAIMVIMTHDFPTKWELEAHVKRDLEDFDRLKPKLIELGLIHAQHGILANPQDKFRHTGIMKFKDIDAYKNCMEAMRGHDWENNTNEINNVFRFEVYVVDYELDT